jgi:hypothetical protein
LAKPLGTFQGQAGNGPKFFVGSYDGHQCILPPKAGSDQGRRFVTDKPAVN